MKHVLDLFLSVLTPTLLFFSLTGSCFANISVQNAEGVTIVFIDEQPTHAIAQEVLINAMSLKGIKYKYGGSSPETGFDCSGFVGYVYDKAANIKLPRTAKGISKVGVHVDRSGLQPGDLVFFNTTRRAFSHVGIYVGEGKFIHAPRTGSHVRIESMQNRYWDKRFNGAKRIQQTAMN